MSIGRPKLVRPPATCHPEKSAFASSGGLCVTCYKREWARAKRKQVPLQQKEYKPVMANCHPEKKHWGLGLCVACYGKAYRKRNPTANKEATARWRRNNPDKIYAKHLRYRYGLTVDGYYQLLKQQNYSCKLCGATPINHPVVDHSHATEKVRGIVCQRCNNAIGLFEGYQDVIGFVPEYLGVE